MLDDVNPSLSDELASRTLLRASDIANDSAPDEVETSERMGLSPSAAHTCSSWRRRLLCGRCSRSSS